MEPNELLKEWAVRYVKNRDLYSGEILGVEDTKTGFIVEYKKGKEEYLIALRIEGAGLKDGLTLVTLNNSDNINTIAKKWENLSRIKGLKIILANPFSSQEERWIIKPEVHAKVCYNKSVKAAMRSMAELVEPITEKEIANKQLL
ncbi:hypothetical protein JXB11_04060 [Candidatus Woesearchaeota archaeon]|nr:hypothetical protein [Candidatus Woesearchaeota archaeon]